ncbi:MAG: hypothetical protein DRQ40_08625 [Gammaproteobacteria bacterium]|nr:MAG: hypothetical protein DRQ40_08625 [Gammaproteobacteria bacterium]
MKLDFGQDSTTNPNNAGGEQWSSSGGVSGSSSSSNSSSWRDPQSVWGGQSPYLQQLYGMGAGMFGGGGYGGSPSGGGSPFTGGAIGQGQMGSNGSFSGGMGQGAPRGFGGQGGQAGAMEARGNNIFNTAQQSFDRLSNPGVNPQLEAYSGEVQRNLERNLLPAIGGQAQGFGQMGGSRQGVAEGLAVSDSNQQITDMASNLYNADMNRMGQAMSQAPGLANFGMGVPWYGMNQYAGLLGDPTVLGGAAGSESSSSSSSFGEDSSSSYGYDYNVGGGTDDRGWNVGVGFPTGGS